MNAQDVNVPDPPFVIYTAPPCCFKIEQRKKENRFKRERKHKKKERVIGKCRNKKNKKIS